MFEKQDTVTLHIRITEAQKWLLERKAWHVGTTYGRFAKRVFDEAFTPTEDEMREFRSWKLSQAVGAPLPGSMPEAKKKRLQREKEDNAVTVVDPEPELEPEPEPEPESEPELEPLQEEDEYGIDDPYFPCPVCHETHYKLKSGEVRRFSGSSNEMYVSGDIVPAVTVTNPYCGHWACAACGAKGQDNEEFVTETD